MRSFKILSVLLITALAVSVVQASPPVAPTIKSEVKKYVSVQDVYTSQIGVREATGKNDGVQVERYLRSVGLGKGYAWCAAFVKWSFDQVGVRTTITAWSPTAHNAKNIVYSSGKFYKDPQPGDVFTLWYPGLKRIAHTGFYDWRQNSTIYRSVEGNTNGAGSREGDGVYVKYRSFKATYSITRWV